MSSSTSREREQSVPSTNPGDSEKSTAPSTPQQNEPSAPSHNPEGSEQLTLPLPSQQADTARFRCFCGKNNTCASQLRNHAYKHIVRKPYYCEQDKCPTMGFATKSKLLAHLIGKHKITDCKYIETPARREAKCNAELALGEFAKRNGMWGMLSKLIGRNQPQGKGDSNSAAKDMPVEGYSAPSSPSNKRKRAQGSEGSSTKVEEERAGKDAPAEGYDIPSPPSKKRKHAQDGAQGDGGSGDEVEAEQAAKDTATEEQSTPSPQQTGT